jgi:gluconate kinase
MPPSLLDSQFADLQEPGPDEPANRIDIGPPPAEIAQEVVDHFGLSEGARKQ